MSLKTTARKTVMSNDDSDSPKRRPRRGERNPRPKPHKFGLSLPRPNPALTQHHAQEVRGIQGGQDIVDQETLRQEHPASRSPAAQGGAFSEHQFVEVKDWLRARPANAATPSAPVISYPRMWSTRRGRYCKFKSPGASGYGLMRARATF